MVAEGRRQVVQQVISITGLDFAQFNGVVILSQGSFSSFLKGHKNDRSQLLERITGTAIYGQLSMAAQQDAAAKKQAVQQLERTIGDIQLLDDVAIAELNTQQQTLAHQLVASEHTLQQHQQHLHALQQVINHQQKWQQAQQRQTQSQAHWRAAASQRQQLRDAALVEPLRVALDRRQQLRQQQQTQHVAWQQSLSLQQNAEAHLQQLQETTLRQVRQLNADAAWVGELRQTYGYLRAADPVRCHRITNELQHVIDDQGMVDQLNEQLTERAASLQQLAQAKAQQRTVMDQQQQLTDQLQQAQQQAEQHYQQLVNEHGELATLQEQRSQAQLHANVIDQLDQIQSAQTTLSDKILQYHQQHQEVEQRRTQQEDFVKQRLQIRDASEQQVTHLRYIVDLSQHRHRLVLDEPCPLCQQPVQQLPDELPPSLLADSEQHLAQCQNDYEASQQEFLALERQAMALANQIAQGREQVSDYRQQTGDLIQKLISDDADGAENAHSAETIPNNPEPDEVTLFIQQRRQAMEQQRATLDTIIHHINTCQQQWQQQTQAWQQQLNQLQQTQSRFQQMEQQYVAISSQQTQLQQQITDRITQLIALQQQLDQSLKHLATDCRAERPDWRLVNNSVSKEHNGSGIGEENRA